MAETHAMAKSPWLKFQRLKFRSQWNTRRERLHSHDDDYHQKPRPHEQQVIGDNDQSNRKQADEEAGTRGKNQKHDQYQMQCDECPSFGAEQFAKEHQCYRDGCGDVDTVLDDFPAPTPQVLLIRRVKSAEPLPSCREPDPGTTHVQGDSPET